MKPTDKGYKIFKFVNNYFYFFAMCAFLVTCTTSLFVTALASSLGVELTGENLNTAAKITFINVMVLSLFFTLIDVIRRKMTTERAAKHISAAAKQITEGDFGVRIEPFNRFGIDDTFGEIAECFNKMAEELSGIETLRNDFISNVSHEMKTPLAVMQNYGALLASDDIDDETRREYAEAVQNGAKRLSLMMSNILKLNRLENQTIYPNAKRYNLSEQICESLLMYEDVFERKNISIETDMPDEVYVFADAELLSLVWNNLLSNAFKFTPEGGTVSVSLVVDGKYATVSIKDTGEGISKEVGAHIFEKFYQGDTSHTKEGNGLGLALVRRVVDIVNGEISVDSTPGVGSTFSVRIEL